jgi:predicted metal-dependent hydrolase
VSSASSSLPIIDRVIRSKRRTMSLEITREGLLIVRAPLDVTREQITALVEQKENWIKTKQEIAHLRKRENPVKEFVAGEEFLYLGVSYPLEVVPEQSNLLELRDKFYLVEDALKDARNIFISWYKERASKVIQGRVNRFARQNGFQYGRLRITDARMRWGSCGRKGALNFTWRLVMAPIEVIDYVVVHEFVHLKVRSHSKDFWSEVNKLLPDYCCHRGWLKEHGHRLTLD